MPPSNKSRDIVMSTVIPRLMESHPSGIVDRPTIMAELTRAGCPIQPWLISKSAGWGVYDISEFYKERNDIDSEVPQSEDTRTDAEVETEINDRFKVVDRMTQGVIDGRFRSLIVSGNPGTGKSFGIEKLLKDAGKKIEYERVTGTTRATGLFRLFWHHREKGSIILIDDSDSVFADDIALNLLKAACDSTQERRIQWRSEKTFGESQDEESDDDIPHDFVYHGHVIFITNINFDRMVASANRLTPHLEALMSRSFYIDLNMRNTRELLARIRWVAAHSTILDSLDAPDRVWLLDYVAAHATVLRELSLRMLVKLSQVLKSAESKEDFIAMAAASCLRSRK